MEPSNQYVRGVLELLTVLLNLAAVGAGTVLGLTFIVATSPEMFLGAELVFIGREVLSVNIFLYFFALAGTLLMPFWCTLLLTFPIWYPMVNDTDEIDFLE